MQHGINLKKNKWVPDDRTNEKDSIDYQSNIVNQTDQTDQIDGLTDRVDTDDHEVDTDDQEVDTDDQIDITDFKTVRSFDNWIWTSTYPSLE